MHFSRLVLNQRSRQVRRDLGNLYEMHRSVTRVFRPEKGEPPRVLWRIESDRKTGVATLLVQSEQAPNWDDLIDQWPDYVIDSTEADLPPLECKERELQFARDQVLAFRLRANPTVKRDGKRYGYSREEDQIRWLERKAERGGFALLNVLVRREKPIAARRASGPPLSFVSAVFEGRMRVADPERLLRAVRNGIGSAKAFGFGLLSLARV